MDLIERIKAKENGFSKGQRKLADYILKEYDKAAFLTASKLGKEAGVSESTVVRFAYELDYDGYPELQKAMNVIVKTQSSSLQRLEGAVKRYGNRNPLKSILKTDMNRIKETIAEIDEAEFEKAIESIVTARKVYIIGARSSGFLAEFLGYYLKMILDDVEVVDFNGEVGVFEQIHRIKPEDVFIGISFPRYSRITAQVQQFASRAGATTIAITDSMQSPMTSRSKINLIAKSDVMAVVDSLTAPLSVINALAVAISIRMKDDVAKRFKILEEMWKEYDIYDKKLM
ncbi:MAG: MurR/RpiR family transcriptional regulator [Anaerostipes sp.]|uniref:MurR/RpiR family transcriptional regulator n=1 Tax=Anaerostipes sp. 992a TaxID=1261637 RepID=UPI00095123CD|nr:MurR/RpiR family transcriptional regulator [Anaerostipes sp. 992a]MCI5951448.1 MurR/RpiR family transcriptional regulator [Anaerostipes sp.]MDD5968733.1 MurR/RpiR family transcriptional regulator [Anaerostipes sp.]OLR62385.1 N-acetylmannosamine kinase [Anaerostipes sp. 992a]